MSRRKPRAAARDAALASESTPDKSRAKSANDQLAGPVPPPPRHPWFLFLTLGLLLAWIAFLAVLAIHS